MKNRIMKKISVCLLAFMMTIAMMPLQVHASTSRVRDFVVTPSILTPSSTSLEFSGKVFDIVQSGTFLAIALYKEDGTFLAKISEQMMQRDSTEFKESYGPDEIALLYTLFPAGNYKIIAYLDDDNLSGGYDEVSFTISGEQTDKEKLDEAKPLAQTVITGITATNDTTAGNILETVTNGISSVTGVTASWKATPTITKATNSADGSITGTIILTSGSETVEVSVSKTINKIPKTDKEKVDEAKPLAQTAITGITATNDTTAGNILETVTNGISSVTGVTASWKATPTITKATSSADGSITGTIILTSGSETVEVSVNKTINKIPKTDKEKVDEAKPLAQTAITGITATNDTTAGNILETVTNGISSVTGVTASWKATPTITKATSSADGSIIGTIILTSGSETVEVSVNKTINKIPKTDKEKVDEAKSLAQTAITGIAATNDTTAGNILETVTNGISSVSGVTASWKATPTITKATSSADGSIIGTIILTSGSESVEVIVNKAIAMLPTPTPEKPTITVGNSGTSHQISSGKDMLFICSGRLEDLTGVYVDDKLVDESNYTLKSGSTISILKASYLDTLSVGKHTLKFQYKDNVSAEIDFTITAKPGETPTQKPETPNKPSSPQTGDTSRTLLYFGLIVLSGCIARFGLKKKKTLNK